MKQGGIENEPHAYLPRAYLPLFCYDTADSV